MMKKYLNTLFVTTQGAYLNKEGEALLVSVEREVRLRVPVHTLAGVVCFGNVMCSPQLMHHCAVNGVAISFLSEHGRFLARVQGPVSGNVLLRREQYRRADDAAASAAIARVIVAAKVANARTVLLRAMRDHGPDQVIDQAATRLGRLVQDVMREEGVDAIRGREGEASAAYFDVFDCLITAQKDAFVFSGRNRRPPTDNVNALLSFIWR